MNKSIEEIKEQNEVLLKMVAFPLGIMISILKFLADGFVFMKIYSWFLAVYFNDKNIDFRVAVGIVILFKLLIHNPLYKPLKEETVSEGLGNIFKPLIFPFVFLAVAFIIKIIL